jgi:hypothetical protein
MKDLLNALNKEYLELHETYEKLFWISYMWDHSKDAEFNIAKSKLEQWKSSSENLARVKAAIWDDKSHTDDILQRLKYREGFFLLFQTPDHVLDIRNKISEVETALLQKLNNYEWYYITPTTWEKIISSKTGLTLMMRSDKNEEIRKACYEWLERGSKENIDELITLVSLKNQYAKALGYKNFYYYKAHIEEKMSADTIFDIFDTYYEKTKSSIDAIKELEKDKPGLLHPWNFNYFMNWNFQEREEKYYNLQTILPRRWITFRNLWITYNWATLQLDLLHRQWKYDNGFCHYPTPVTYIDWVKSNYQCNFTCNAVPWKIWAWKDTEITLFHEWWHAADRAWANMEDICLNTEYPPSSTAWSETQSMFCDTICSSIEWKTRYAQTLDWEYYPWDLYEEKVRALHILRPRELYSIAAVIAFEKDLYANENITKDRIVEHAHNVSKKYFCWDLPYARVLTVPHIYSRESSCSYHWYWLAEIALTQWRDYFHKKYWYIVDNKEVWRELKKARETWAAKSFEEHIIEATGQKLNPQAYIEEAMQSVEETLATSRKRIDALSSIPKDTSPVDLDAKIALVHGYEVIGTNEISFEDMCTKFAEKVKMITE